MAESGGNGARKFPAGGALAGSNSQPAPGEAALRAPLSLGQWVTCPATCVMPVAPCLLLGSGHSQSGQDP